MDLPRSPRKRSGMRISNNSAYLLNTSNTRDAAGSSFISANDVRIKDGTFSMKVTNNITASTISAMDVLYKRVAPHAILNKGGRGEDAKCHPGTRLEVIRLIETWMDDTGSDRIFWMSGPAGGGKTAIMKTIAARSSNRDAPTINFFFFRGDPTRNSVQPLIATLLYQLFRLYPLCATVAAEIFCESPRILDESLDEQCGLISALFPVIRRSIHAGAPIILLVDGLDECDIDGESAQLDILRAFERLVTQAESPFRLLVASRREARIQMAFNELPSRAHSIFLSEEYSPEKDIRIFVEAEFTRIKKSHPINRSLPSDWPSPSVVDEIIVKSSGQFIYAATVMRYISDPDTPPTLRLAEVMSVVSPVNNSPFASLDNVYMFILNRANDQDAIRDMLSVKVVNRTIGDIEIIGYYNSRYNRDFIESCVSKLSSIIRLNIDGDIQFYHASLTDFLIDRSRSGPYWIETNTFKEQLVVLFWRKHLADNTFSGDHLLYNFIDLQKPNPIITHLLVNMPLKWMFSESSRELLGLPWAAIKTMYYDSDIRTYKKILRRAIIMAMSCNADLTNASDLPHAAKYISHYRRWMWWLQLLHILHRE